MPAARNMHFSPPNSGESPLDEGRGERFSKRPGEIPAGHSAADYARHAASREFAGHLDTLLTAATELTHHATFNTNIATSNDPTVASITARPESPVGEDYLVVAQLAKAHKIMTRPFASCSTALGISGRFGVNGKSIPIGISDTLADIAEKINAADTGAGAAIATLGPNDVRMTLTSRTTGVAGAVAVAGVLEPEFTGEVAPAQDACFSLNGAIFKRPSNVIDDTLPGISLTLLPKRPMNLPATSVLAVSRDSKCAIQRLNAFLSAFNDFQSFRANYARAYGSDSGQPIDKEVFARVQHGLNSALQTGPGGAALDLIGVTRGHDGLLELDSIKFGFVHQTDPEFVMRLFGVEEERARRAASRSKEDVGDPIAGRLKIVTVRDIAVNGTGERAGHGGVLDHLIHILSEVLDASGEQAAKNGPDVDGGIREIEKQITHLNTLAANCIGQIRQTYSTLEYQIADLESQKQMRAA